MYGVGIGRGLLVTFKNLVLPSRFFTLHQYPDRKIGLIELARRNDTNPIKYTFRNPGKAAKALVGLISVEDKMPQHPRFRGQEFTFYEQRCTVCASCAKYCPLGIIRIVSEKGSTSMQEGGEYKIDTFDIDIGRCMFCGLCVEACPYDALHMGSGFEESVYTRDELFIQVDRLRGAPKRPSTWHRPQLEEKGYDPVSGQEIEWGEVGRHKKPNSIEQKNRWSR